MRYSKRIIAVALLLLTVLTAQAQDRLFVYRHALAADTLLMSDVATISHSRLDLDSLRHTDFVTMAVTLKDGAALRYLLTTVDSVVLEQDGQRHRLTEFCGRMTSQSSAAKSAPRRTSLDGDFSAVGEPVEFFWEDGDHLYLADGRHDTQVTLDRYTSPTEKLHAEQATFFFDGDPITADEVTVYYPGQQSEAYNQVRVAAKQSQTAVSSSMHLGQAGDCGTAVAKRQDDGSYQFTLRHRAAYLCFLPCIGNSLGRTQLKQITVRSDSAIAGVFTLSPDGLKPSKDTTHVITLTTADFVLPKSSSAATTAFMVLAPQSGPLRLSCEFTVYDPTIESTGTFTKTLDLDRVDPNVLYLVKANLSNYVCDLGLPYLVMNHNMGATAPEEYGGYYAWGEQTDKTYYGYSNYAYNYNDIGTDIKLTKYDVAHMRLGQDYSMPNIDELYMLRDSCTAVWTTINGINGYKFTGKNGNNVFFPAAGCRDESESGNLGTWCQYRSSTRSNKEKNVTWTTLFGSDATKYEYNKYNYQGMSIRPVISRAGQMLDGTVLQVSTTAPTWTPGAREATLNGSVYGLGKAKTPVTVGFVVGATPQVTTADGTTVLVSSPADGAISATFSPVEDSKDYYYRAFIRYDQDSIRYASARQFGSGFVDLGLPSGTLWSSVNLGASSPDQDGDYYAWGETSPKDTYYRSNNRWYVQGTYLEPNHLRDLQATAYDAATANWGGTAMTPTKADLTELINGCTVTQEMNNGMPGYRFTSKTNGNSIFLTRSGWRDGTNYLYYTSSEIIMSSLLSENSSDQIWGLNSGVTKNDDARFMGLTVRPIRKTNATATDGSPLFIRTLPAGKQFDGTTETDTLRALVRGTVGQTPVGIVWWKDGTDRASGTTVAITPDADGNIETIISGLTAGTTYAYQVYAGTGSTTSYGDTLYVDAVGQVDLGLSVKWANVNVDAVSQEDGGNFYQWGATLPYRDYQQCYKEDQDITPESGRDIAQLRWGIAYRMPTKNEMQELIDNCTWTLTTRHGMKGYVVTSKVAGYTGRSIFLPFAGWSGSGYVRSYGSYAVYWTSTVQSSASVYRMEISSSYNRITSTSKYYSPGFFVRPVVVPDYVVTTSQCDWTIGAATATLSGKVKIVTKAVESKECGFAIGNTPDLDAATATTRVPTTAINDNAFSATYPYDGSAKYFRAYVKVGDTYYQGQVMSISAAHLLDVAFRTDNSAFDASPSALRVTKRGTPAVAWNDTYHRNEATLTNSPGNEAAQFYSFNIFNNTDAKAAMQKSLTLEVLMKMDAPTNNNECDIFSSYEYGGCGIDITNKVIRSLFYINGSYQDLSSTVTPETDQYYHILVVYSQEDGTLTLYVNGEKNASMTVSGTLGLGSNSFMVGGNPRSDGASGSDAWAGTISVARIYDKALTADEVTTLYNNLKK